jgi:NTP pyrophosphatase (non-canonical NTP hydrolase)
VNEIEEKIRSKIRSGINSDIQHERMSQIKRFGYQNYKPEVYFTILSEEVGEVAKEIIEMTFQAKEHHDYRKELVQVAAVALAMIEELDVKTGAY